MVSLPNGIVREMNYVAISSFTGSHDKGVAR